MVGDDALEVEDKLLPERGLEQRLEVRKEAVNNASI